VPDGTVPDGTAAEPRRIELAGRRRAPRFRAFVLTGAVIGLAVGGLAAWLAPGDAASQFTDQTVAGFLGVALALVGALAGGAAAVLADRRSGSNL
jgi:hypothetical protein